MRRDIAAELRELVAQHMVAAAPIASGLLAIADEMDSVRRGFDAVVERIEALEAEVLPQAPAGEIGLP